MHLVMHSSTSEKDKVCSGVHTENRTKTTGGRRQVVRAEVARRRSSVERGPFGRPAPLAGHPNGQVPCIDRREPDRPRRLPVSEKGSPKCLAPLWPHSGPTFALT